MPTKKELQALKETTETLKALINRLNKRVARLECLKENNDVNPKFSEEEDESDSSLIVSDDDDENC